MGHFAKPVAQEQGNKDLADIGDVTSLLSLLLAFSDELIV